MSKSYPCHFKYCATCAYWVGYRTTDNFGNYAEVLDERSKGKCMAPYDSGWRLQQRDPSSTCSGYKKWEVLR